MSDTVGIPKEQLVELAKWRAIEGDANVNSTLPDDIDASWYDLLGGAKVNVVQYDGMDGVVEVWFETTVKRWRQVASRTHMQPAEYDSDEQEVVIGIRYDLGDPESTPTVDVGYP